MKSGLRDRNNKMIDTNLTFRTIVSMKSGLGDRNNVSCRSIAPVPNRSQ